MKERPMIFSDEMVRAILDGRKTQTRKPIRAVGQCCPFGQPGDRLWVRERFVLLRDDKYLWTGAPKDAPQEFRNPVFRADFSERDAYPHGGWFPSTRMPRWASWITLEIVAVRVERLHAISEADARAEGVSPLGDDRNAHLYGFSHLWGRIYGLSEYAWRANPWVWVVEFRRVEV